MVILNNIQEDLMPTFMMSLNWTDQGIRAVKDSSSEMSFLYSSADHARTVRVRTFPSELTASANLATLSPLGASTKMTRSLSPDVR
jgi:hypothetical protein